MRESHLHVCPPTGEVAKQRTIRKENIAVVWSGHLSWCCVPKLQPTLPVEALQHFQICCGSTLGKNASRPALSLRLVSSLSPQFSSSVGLLWRQWELGLKWAQFSGLLRFLWFSCCGNNGCYRSVFSLLSRFAILVESFNQLQSSPIRFLWVKLGFGLKRTSLLLIGGFVAFYYVLELWRHAFS